MAESSLAGVITACGAVLTALSLVIGSITLLVPILRTTRSTHKIVNQQRTDMLNFQRALIRALDDAGVSVPVDQSVEPAE